MTKDSVKLDIIAHRGFWVSEEEKNTPASFEKALSSGFGIETDFRDFKGKLVVSHDIPTGNEQSFSEFIEQVNQYNPRATIAINVKSDGLQNLLSCLHTTTINYFVFDMSVPDMLGYFKQDFCFFTRHSEYETKPALLEPANGVWMDNFSSDTLNTEALNEFLLSGKKVALVSPELHNFQPINFWQKLHNYLTSNPQFYNQVILCTDYPQKARDFFNV